MFRKPFKISKEKEEWKKGTLRQSKITKKTPGNDQETRGGGKGAEEEEDGDIMKEKVKTDRSNMYLIGVF